MSKIIEVTVSPNGQTTIETTGFQGNKCREATRRLETALGLTQTEKLTQEFYVRTENQQSAQQQ